MDNKKKMHLILDQLHKEYPDAKVSLSYNNPFQLLVATILSAQSTDAAVNEVTPELFDRYPSPKDLSKAKQSDVIRIIRSIGLYNRKSKSLIDMAKTLVEEYDSKVPRTMKDLTSLSGVGRKTANVIMGNAFKIKDSGITVDTHVKRLSQRMGFTNGKSARKIEKDLMKIVPKDEWVQITHLFISHGRQICDARSPSCDTCVISEYCESAFDFDHFDTQ